MVWQDKLTFCCRIQFYAESALPISQKLSSNKMSLLSGVFWPWTALGTARISTRRRRQKAGREMSAVSSLKQHGLPKMKENPHLPMSKEGKSTRFMTEIKAFDYCQELYITCWLALFLLTVCPWTLLPGFLPHSGTRTPKHLQQPLQHSPLLQAHTVQERAGRTPSPCFWAKRGQQATSESGRGQEVRRGQGKD